MEKWIINYEERIKLTLEILIEKLKDIPEDKIAEPESYVILAIQQLSYCKGNESSKNLYANLFVCSMKNTDKKSFVHLSFVHLPVKQIWFYGY